MKKEKKLNLGVIALILIIILVIAIIAIVKSNTKEENNNELEIAKTNTIQGDNEDTEPEPIVENNVETVENDTKLNISEVFNKEREFEGLTLTDIQLTSKDSQTQLLMTATNNTSKDKDLMEVEVTLLDEDGNKITTLTGIISPVKAGESTQVNISSSLDYANAYDFKITKK